ncbi:MAG: endo-1,4-beta-xylanase [Armatimonadetes bacterium]|nr:endo-1,4-beta-xylanase [Armatimonadota bacterium]
MRTCLFTSVALGLTLAAGETNALTDQEVLDAAPARIREHRMGDLTVRVIDAAGRPIPGAVVKIEQQRHAFLFGCNAFMLNAGRDAEFDRRYADAFSGLLNYATLPFYWAGFEHTQGQPGYARTDAIAAWCAEHGVATKGHPLVWNHPAGVPGWLPADLGEVRRLSDERVKAIVARYAGRIDRWDVVNEAADPDRFQNRMSAMLQQAGLMEVVRESFRLARAANPKATLLINDYQLGEGFEKVIRELVDEQGKPLYDVVGLQTHQHGVPIPVSRLWVICDQFARFVVPLHFTETTLLSGGRLNSERGISFEGREKQFEDSNPAGEAKQAAAVARFYTALFSHPAVEAITWWDFSDRGAWLGAPAGFLRADGSPKPAYDELLKLIRGAWWTRAELTADAAGTAALRVFAGEHWVTVETPRGKAEATVTVQRRGAAEVTLRPGG